MMRIVSLAAIQRITVGMLFRPGETLDTVMILRRQWVYPLIGALVGSVLVTNSVAMPLRALMLTSAPQDALGEVLFSPIGIWLLCLLNFLAGVGVLWVFQSVLLALVSRLGARPLRFGMARTLIGWLWLPLALRMGFHGLMFPMGGIYTDNGLSFLIPHADLSFAWHLLRQFDLFFLWHLVLVWAALHRFAWLNSSRAIDGVLLYGVVIAPLMAGLGLWHAGG